MNQQHERLSAFPGKRRLALAALAAVFCLPLVVGASYAPAPALSILTVGGGPEPEHNQIAIESNVRYVDSLLPKEARRSILFADGKPDTPTVLYHEPGQPLPPPEAAFRFLRGESRDNGQDKYRAPKLPAIDGAARKASISAAFDKLTAQVNADPKGDTPVVVYFTGHGNRDRRGNLDNNVFALWNNENLSVRDLAAELKKLPRERPVVLIMVQCYSGSFGNLIFSDGDPEAGALENRPFCGFFAATRERVAAGCTPEIDEASYRDFTGYFFAALTGKDRLGRPVPAPDYDKNGKVGMDEAFAYALATEPSIDVPVATSDVFLRRFVPMKDDAEVAAVPFAKVREMASPAQRAALDGISKSLGLTGENRLQVALDNVRGRAAGSASAPVTRQNSEHEGHEGHETGGPAAAAATAPTRLSNESRGYLRQWRDTLVREFPDLRSNPNTITYRKAREQAIGHLAAHPDVVERLNRIAAESDRIGEARYQEELRGALYLRLIRVAKSVVLAKRLRDSGDRALIARYDRLVALESANPLRG